MTVQTDFDEVVHAQVASAAAMDEVLFGGDPSKLSQPIKTVEDKYQLLPAFLKVRGLVKQVNLMMSYPCRIHCSHAGYIMINHDQSETLPVFHLI